MVGSLDGLAAAADANEERTTKLRKAIMETLRTELDSKQERTEAETEEALFAAIAALAHCAGHIMRRSTKTQLMKEMHASLIEGWTE